MEQTKANDTNLTELAIPLERDGFLRTLIRELAGALQDVVGLEEAAGFISVVGQSMGQQINQDYKRALQTNTLTRDQIVAVLIDFKRRIKGDFYLISQDDEKIVFGNRACPFADKVAGRPAICMMTTNIFGSITAENLGYAKVELQETMALGYPGCKVVVHLQPTPTADACKGREFFKGEH